jgi:hypothetical protein
MMQRTTATNVDLDWRDAILSRLLAGIFHENVSAKVCVASKETLDR